MVAAGAVLALGLQPVLRPEAASVLAVPEEGLVVQLQVTQGLALFLWLQCAELWAAGRLSTGSATGSPASALGGPWGWPTVTRDQERMSCRSRQKLCHARRLFMSTCSWCQSATKAWCWASSLAGQGVVRGIGAPTHCHPVQQPDPRPPTW